MIISREKIELEVVLQEYTYCGVKRLVLHIGGSVPLHPRGYDGITLIKLTRNKRGVLRWDCERFPFILYWGADHSSPCRSWEDGLKGFENHKIRFLKTFKANIIQS